MDKITPELLREISNNLMLELEKEEYKVLVDEFYVILEQMKLVQKIDIEEYEPMHYPFSTSTHQLREDKEVRVVDKDLILKNAPQVQGDYITINKVIE